MSTINSISQLSKFNCQLSTATCYMFPVECVLSTKTHQLLKVNCQNANVKGTVTIQNSVPSFTGHSGQCDMTSSELPS